MTRQRLTSRFLKINLFALALLHAGLSAPASLARQESSAPAIRPAQSPDADGPVTRSWLLYVLRPTGLDAAEIVRRVEQRGVAFRVSAEDEAWLRAAGATPALIEAAHGNYRGPLDRKELEAMLRLTRRRPPRTTPGGVVGEIKKRGVVFKLTPRNTAALQKAGATKDVIVAARDNYHSEAIASTPRLPLPTSITADPSLFPPDQRPLPYDHSKSPPPASFGKLPPIKSSEQGGGMGTGSGVGAGMGEGVGLGRGGNTGGGDANIGGGGPGVSREEGDYTRPFESNELTRKALITYKPEPGFTEKAKHNNVSGVVRLRVLLHYSGAVKNISIVRGLPDGLTEKAIAAAKWIRFRPAEKDGRAVSQYVVIEYNFNIY